jgi:periplasmic divalent cation tolerance protein
VTAVIVLTTVGADFDARGLARFLVEERLAACVNIVDRVTSIYRWEGRTVEERELLLLIKTTDERLSQLCDALREKHPYDVPEFVVLAIDEIRGPYRDWLLGAVSVD